MLNDLFVKWQIENKNISIFMINIILMSNSNIWLRIYFTRKKSFFFLFYIYLRKRPKQFNIKPKNTPPQIKILLFVIIVFEKYFFFMKDSKQFYKNVERLQDKITNKNNDWDWKFNFIWSNQESNTNWLFKP